MRQFRNATASLTDEKIQFDAEFPLLDIDTCNHYSAVFYPQCLKTSLLLASLGQRTTHSTSSGSFRRQSLSEIDEIFIWEDTSCAVTADEGKNRLESVGIVCWKIVLGTNFCNLQEFNLRGMFPKHFLSVDQNQCQIHYSNNLASTTGQLYRSLQLICTPISCTDILPSSLNSLCFPSA